MMDSVHHPAALLNTSACPLTLTQVQAYHPAALLHDKLSALMLMKDVAQHLAGDRERILREGFLTGWDSKTLIPVAVQAAGGLCVGQVRVVSM